MTLSTLLLMMGAIAAVLTAVMYLFRNNENVVFKNMAYSFVQNFVGALFIFSGAVKAIDPLGTAYKMEQYFSEFENTFNGTMLSGISGIFPFLATFALAVSISMIIFEIVLGVLLIIGHARKFATWGFLLLIIFFTFLTGFTYLTGHVPNESAFVLADAQGETVQLFESEFGEKLDNGWAIQDTIKPNFFKFASWTPWVETNMKVTDCGCFGDFLKLDPFVSFMKDIFLLIPGFIFLFFGAHSHKLFSARTRQIITAFSTVFLLAFTIYYSTQQLPLVDFRPFNNGKDVRTTKKAELDAMGAVQVTGFTIRNTKTGQVAEMSMASYATDIANYKEEDGWDKSTIRQVKTEPAIQSTKISEYHIQGEKTMIVKYATVLDAVGDTLEVDFDLSNSLVDNFGDTTGFRLVDKHQESITQEMDIEDDLLGDKNYSFMVVCYKLEKANKAAFKAINALHAGAEGDGLNFYTVSGSADDVVEAFRHEVQSPYVFYSADDILLKTIIRSTPGVVLWKDGKILQKWHYKHLPSYEEIKAKYFLN